jgi:Transposase zinc-binding domain
MLTFSCKRRGFCPSCGAKRMSETAAYLVDHVIPSVPVRQWVLSLPIALRVLLALEPIGADFEEQFCALKARSVKQTSQRAVRQSSLRAIY